MSKKNKDFNEKRQENLQFLQKLFFLIRLLNRLIFNVPLWCVIVVNFEYIL